MESVEKLPENRIDKRNSHLNPKEGLEIARLLGDILDRYKDERVLVLAPPCSGKSTLLQHIKDGIDMDIVFDSMPDDLRRYILHHEYPFMFVDGDRETIKYTEREYAPDDESENYLRTTTELLADYTNEYLKIMPGKPVFGTSLIDTDVIVYLRLSDDIFNSRLYSRNTKTHRPLQESRVRAIRRLIEEELENAKNKGVVVEEFKIV